jgi:Anti-sigma-K factor rskA
VNVVGGPGRDDRDDAHASWDELAVGWALHALEPEDEALFTGHLAGCARCAQTAADTAEVMGAMAGDLPPAEPSEGLRERLRAAVEETEQLPQVPRAIEPPRTPPRAPSAPAPLAPAGDLGLRTPLPVPQIDRRAAWRRVLPTALIAAAVAAVLSMAAWNVVVSSDRDAAEAVAAEQSAMLDDLLAPGRVAVAPVTQDGARVATVLARDDQAQVIASGLPVNDSHDQVYVLWGIQGNVPQPLGTFDVVTPQTDLRTVGSSATGLDSYSVYAISIEPGRQMPSSPTDVVGQGEVTS